MRRRTRTVILGGGQNLDFTAEQGVNGEHQNDFVHLQGINRYDTQQSALMVTTIATANRTERTDKPWQEIVQTRSHKEQHFHDNRRAVEGKGDGQEEEEERQKERERGETNDAILDTIQDILTGNNEYTTTCLSTYSKKGCSAQHDNNLNATEEVCKDQEIPRNQTKKETVFL